MRDLFGKPGFHPGSNQGASFFPINVRSAPIARRIPVISSWHYSCTDDAQSVYQRAAMANLDTLHQRMIVTDTDHGQHPRVQQEWEPALDARQIKHFERDDDSNMSLPVLAQRLIAAQNAVPYQDAGILSWPVLGIAIALLCTVAWCGFLTWLLVGL